MIVFLDDGRIEMDRSGSKDQLGHAFFDSTMVYVKSMPLRTRSEYDFYKPAYMWGCLTP
jgi:hypothetical protein